MEYISKVADLLNKSVDCEIDACMLVEDHQTVKTKDLKAALESRNVPAAKVSGFVAVFRAVKQGLSLGLSRDQMRHLPVGHARLISKGMLDNKPVTKDTFEVALNKDFKAADVVSTFDKDAAEEMREKERARKQAKAEQDLFDSLKPEEKAIRLVGRMIEQLEGLGFNKAQISVIVKAALEHNNTSVKAAAVAA